GHGADRQHADRWAPARMDLRRLRGTRRHPARCGRRGRRGRLGLRDAPTDRGVPRGRGDSRDGVGRLDVGLIAAPTRSLLPVRRLAALTAAALLALVVAGTTTAQASSPFAAADATLRTRVADDGLSGGVLLVARGDELVHRDAVGRMGERTVIPIASAGKWLTSATLMTFVDEGRVRLDDPVSDYLPGFDGAKAGITVRELLAHRTGLPAAACEGDPSSTLARCLRSIA